MEKVTVPEGSLGNWKVQHFEIPKFSIEGARLMMRGRGCRPGIYTRLTRNGSVIMSDTDAERSDHWEAGDEASGSVLIVGLGLGMCLQAIAAKPEVTHVHVIELEQDVIDLVWPHYAEMFGAKISVERADAFIRTPRKGERYDYAWWDIWDNISGDNYLEMKALVARWRGRIKRQNCWVRDQVRHLHMQDRDRDYEQERIADISERMKDVTNPVPA